MNASPTAKKLIVTSVVIALGALMAWAGSSHGATVGDVPVFAVAVLAAFVVQWLVFIPSAIGRTERFFDLTGSVTYVGISAGLLLALSEVSTRAAVLGALVIVWALRLGTFLFVRVSKDGSDSRFEEIKKSPLRFFNVWTIQGLWITFTAAAAWIAMGSSKQASVNALMFVGVALWAAGFVIEVVADAQKYKFRSDPANRDRFIKHGVWAWSQHPNYFGEILLWAGIAVIAVPNFEGWQYLGLLSPVFVFLLLTRVSGIPLLQKKASAKWGDDLEYQEYKKRTPLLVPLPPRQ